MLPASAAVIASRQERRRPSAKVHRGFSYLASHRGAELAEQLRTALT